MAKLKKAKSSLVGRLIKFANRQGLHVALIILGLVIGWTLHTIQASTRPPNLVWAIDHTVTVPSKLRKLLLNQDNCQNYQGIESPKGVGLWAVLQVEQDKFAKVTYGCSWSLSGYVIAIKENGNWRLIPRNEYFDKPDSVGALPTCKAVKQYQVPNNMEPFCSDDTGKAISNN